MQGSEASPTGEPRIESLIEAAAAGDQDAFGQLVELKRDLIYRVAHQQCRDADAALSVTQDVFIRLWRHLPQYDRSRRFDTWLYQVTVNAAVDHHRRGSRRRREDEFDEAQHAGATTAIETAGPEKQVLSDEVQRIMTELSAELTEKQRAAFVLREVEGLSTAEVAEVLQATESTIRNHVFQARRVLRDALVTRYPEYAGHLAPDASTPPPPEDEP